MSTDSSPAPIHDAAPDHSVGWWMMLLASAAVLLGIPELRPLAPYLGLLAGGGALTTAITLHYVQRNIQRELDPSRRQPYGATLLAVTVLGGATLCLSLSEIVLQGIPLQTRSAAHEASHLLYYSAHLLLAWAQPLLIIAIAGPSPSNGESRFSKWPPALERAVSAPPTAKALALSALALTVNIVSMLPHIETTAEPTLPPLPRFWLYLTLVGTLAFVLFNNYKHPFQKGAPLSRRTAVLLTRGSAPLLLLLILEQLITTSPSLGNLFLTAANFTLLLSVMAFLLNEIRPGKDDTDADAPDPLASTRALVGGTIIAVIVFEAARFFSHSPVPLLLIATIPFFLGTSQATIRELRVATRITAESGRSAMSDQNLHQVAHEIFNPLVPVQGLLNHPKLPALLERPIDYDAELERGRASLQRLLPAARDGLHHSIAFVEGLRENNGFMDPQVEEVELKPLLDEFITHYQTRNLSRFGEVTIRYVPIGGEPKVTTDPRRLKSTLRILLDNAVEATAPERENRIAVTAEVAPDGTVELKIRDSGTGMNDEQRERYGTPQQSQKVNGNGVGTAIGHRFMKESGGSLALEESIPGEGTVVLLRLPPFLENPNSPQGDR